MRVATRTVCQSSVPFWTRGIDSRPLSEFLLVLLDIPSEISIYLFFPVCTLICVLMLYLYLYLYIFGVGEGRGLECVCVWGWGVGGGGGGGASKKRKAYTLDVDGEKMDYLKALCLLHDQIVYLTIQVVITDICLHLFTTGITQRQSYFIQIDGHILPNHVLKSVTDSGAFDCAYLCMRHGNSQSFNVCWDTEDIESSSHSVICYLSSTTAEGAAEGLVPRPGCQYFSTYSMVEN